MSEFGFKGKADGVNSFNAFKLGSDKELQEFDSFFTGRGGDAPILVSSPVVTGIGVVGQTLTTTNGTWAGTLPITYTYQWIRNFVPISGATSQTYVLVSADAGSNVSCNVIATNSFGVASDSSNEIAVITYEQSLIDAFKIRVAADEGTYEAESCQLAQLTALNIIP